MAKLMGREIRSSSTVLHMNWASVSSFVAKYSRVEKVLESPVMESTWTEVRMETPTQETNNTEKPHCEYRRSKHQIRNLTKQLKKKKRRTIAISQQRFIVLQPCDIHSWVCFHCNTCRKLANRNKNQGMELKSHSKF